MRIFTFIFLGYLIINILSIEILRKDGSKKTRDGYIVFDSSEFLVGDTMHFEIESSSSCDDYLYYQYYDNIDNINISYSNFNQMYSVKYNFQSSVTVNGELQSLTRHFKIEKKREELADLEGNYLYLEFDCFGSVEISNTKSSGKTIIIIVVVIVVFIIVVLIFVLVFCCICRYYKRSINNIYDTPVGYPPQVNPYYPQQPIYPPPYGINPMAYQVPNAIPNVAYNNPINVNNDVPNNVPIVQNETNAMNEAIPPSSTKRDVNHQYFEKPEKIN